MTLGTSHRQLDGMSGAGLFREDILLPVASISNYFSSASDGGASAAQTLNGLTAPTALFRSAPGKRPLFYGRMPLVTAVNGSGLLTTCTVRLGCRRFGKTFFQDVTVTAGTLSLAAASIVDEIFSMTVVNVAGNGAGDTIAIGFDDSWIGLRAPFARKISIRTIYKIANGTPDANGPKMNSDLTAAMVKSNRDSAINVKSLYSAAIAVTDRYLIEYSADGAPDFYPVTGTRFAG